ncbi:MAG: hypothetical protein K6F05_00880, partial [Succinivibrio sp.]|nr:hypothetical protein [Succinivibrio sp.]
AMLVDHPLSNERISLAESRIRQFKSKRPSRNASFDLCKARIDVRYMRFDLKSFKQNLLQASASKANSTYRNYALALIAYEEKNYNEAAGYLASLAKLSRNIFVLDLKTDVDLKLGRGAQSSATLASLYQKRPLDEAVALNYANAQLELGNSRNAIKILEKFTRKKPQNLTAWDLLAEAYQKAGNRCSLLQAQGEAATLKAQYNVAIGKLNEGLNTCHDSYTREILKAKITKVNELRNFDEGINQSMR